MAACNASRVFWNRAAAIWANRPGLAFACGVVSNLNIQVCSSCLFSRLFRGVYLYGVWARTLLMRLVWTRRHPSDPGHAQRSAFHADGNRIARSHDESWGPEKIDRV